MKKKIVPVLIAVLGSISTHAQNVLLPVESNFNKKWIKNGRTEFACFAYNNGERVYISSFIIDISLNSKTLGVYTNMKLADGSTDEWIDTSIADANTFKPIYRSSYSRNRNMVLKYGNEVTGYNYDKQSKKRTTIKEPVKEAVFDSYVYPYLLGLLPLSLGYSAEMPVYDYKPENSSNIKKTRIEEVKSNLYKSGLTGEHKVFQVSVFEEATNDRYTYYIDKDTRRLWKIDILTKGQQLVMIDAEIDFNPFKSKFDKESTMKMLKAGNAVISGQAYAKDNENEGLLKGMAILNINKKQFAQAGTTIVLIPYTDFFKEWMKLNESSRKKGTAVPLPKEVAECIKVATVYDDKGHFEFVNLMPGEYLLYTEFGYVHTTSRTEVVGYTDTYINGMFQYSNANTETYRYGTNASAAIKKVITIKTAGENVEVKLKKTR
jgi:hypothetical protein